MKMKQWHQGGLCVLLLATAACQQSAETETEIELAETESSLVTCAELPAIEQDKSLIVTDHIILDDNFSFERVMTQIVTSANINQDVAQTYHRWWDTQNSSADAVFANGIHCDDETTAAGQPSFNGYPWQCSRNEGVLANPQNRRPFCQGQRGCTGYRPIALVNRFDMAPTNGEHCGEYRLTYGKAGGPGGRNLIIFEAQLPNPNPAQGLEGCRPVAEFWGLLSNEVDPIARRNQLVGFFFNGLPGFAPVVQWDHFTHDKGQIRTNQFMTGPNARTWQLREFRTECAPGSTVANCNLHIVSDTTKGVAFAPLFDPSNTSPEAQIWQGEDAANFDLSFIAQIQNLVGNDLGSLAINVNELLLSGQSTSEVGRNPATRDSDYTFWLNRGGQNSRFRDRIQQELTSLGSNLTPNQVVERAAFTTCGGCHQFSAQRDLGGGLVAPRSANFVHISENNNRNCNGGANNCFAISRGLRDSFLPGRTSLLENFLGLDRCGTTETPAPAPEAEEEAPVPPAPGAQPPPAPEVEEETPPAPGAAPPAGRGENAPPPRRGEPEPEPDSEGPTTPDENQGQNRGQNRGQNQGQAEGDNGNERPAPAPRPRPGQPRRVH